MGSYRLKTIVMLLAFVLVFTSTMYPSIYSNFKIEKIKFRFINKIEKRENNYLLLVSIKKNDNYDLSRIRESIANLNKTGQFNNIEVKAVKLNDKKIKLIFILHFKFKIRRIKMVQRKTLMKLNILDSVFSLRKNSYFYEEKIPEAIIEIKNTLKLNGYESPKITYKTTENISKGIIDIFFEVKRGPVTKINRIDLIMEDKVLKKKILSYFNFSNYIPKKFQIALDKAKALLKSNNYFFPEISLNEKFIGKNNSKINIDIEIDPGYKYLFRFIGMKKNLSAISVAWKNKVFEKWAEKESVTRLLNYLYTKGYLKATIRSEILKYKDKLKTIVFYVNKGKKYYLNKLNIIGNVAISEKRIREVINADKLLYNKLFGFNIETILVDIKVLELLYLNKGYKFIKIDMKNHFNDNKVDIELNINEGKKNIVDSIIFSGNHSISTSELSKRLNLKENGPYIKTLFKRDVEEIKRIYLNRGFRDSVVNYEISKGPVKSILISIDEGNSFTLSQLVIIGASKTQQNLLRKKFPIKHGEIYNIVEVEKFRREMENSGIFNRFDYSEINKGRMLDIIIKVIPEKSKYYGFGLGWEDRRNRIRGTVEWQIQNIFNSYSTFSTTLQLLGIKEIRGTINYETPYLFNSEIDSSMRMWMENEIYPSYKSDRFGLGESIIKKLNPGSYISASYMWYRTDITEIFGNTALAESFNTSALSLLYVVENRDNPFNPTKGDFFSTTLKVAFPLFSESVFYKFFWSYQNNWKFIKTGVLSLSVRNGFAAGDLHISERFFAGGSHTFRGTPNDRLGPINTDYDEPRGGNAMILLNLEATFPISIFPINNLYYSVFLDVGNIYWDTKDFNIQKVEKAIGFGLKYRTPMGPLKIGFGLNFRGANADRFFNFYIGFGNVF